MPSGVSNSPSSANSLPNFDGGKFARAESMAYPGNSPSSLVTKFQFYARQNSKAVFASVAFVFLLLIVTSDFIHDMGSGSDNGHLLRGSTRDQATHWGGAIRPGYFSVNDSVIAGDGFSGSNTKSFRFATVTDLDQLSVVDGASKPEFQSYCVPGVLKQTNGNEYEITFETPRTLITKHNEAGRGAEFSELTIYNDRLLTFDDRTGGVFEIINNDDGTKSDVIPRFLITEGEGETDKGMKWEWATVKDGSLYMGSMGKEYTNEKGEVVNENNLWIGILNARGELQRENWKDKFTFVRKQLDAVSPGYIIMEAILWSEHMKKWVFLPRRISSTQYDEDEDERKGGKKLVLVDEFFTTAEVVTIQMEDDPLRGFSSFSFVPGTNDRHALAIRSVEENCTGDLAVCQQRSYFLVFDVKTGKLLSPEIEYKDQMKFEGIEFVNMYAVPGGK